MTADEKMNNLGLVNRGSKKFPDYGHKDDDRKRKLADKNRGELSCNFWKSDCKFQNV